MKPVEHCRDERISKTQEPLCHKQAKSASELIANCCRNCGRPFTEEGEE